MRLIRDIISTACIGLAGIGLAGFAHAQVAEQASPPEVGEAPTTVEIEVAPQPGSEVEIEVESATMDSQSDIDVSTPGELPSPLDITMEGPVSIDQRVDDTSTNEAIRVAPRSRKNVTRVDNRPNKPRAKLIAVIKGPVAPWGYTTRYLSGEVQRTSAKDLQGGDKPGAPRQGGLTNSSSGGASRSRGAAARRNRD